MKYSPALSTTRAIRSLPAPKITHVESGGISIPTKCDSFSNSAVVEF